MTPNFLTSIFSAVLITGCLSAPSGLVAPLVAHPKAHSVVAVAAAPVVATVSEQHHAQDELGQYNYGYSNPLSAKEEVKTVDGITRGGYSYLDSHGLVQSVNYVSDDVNGFRVAASNLPLGPVVPAQDEPVVAHAKAQAVAALAEAAVKDAAEAAAVAKAAAEPLQPIVVAPVPADAVAVDTETSSIDSSSSVVSAGPVVSEESPVSAAVPEAAVVAVTPLPPTPIVTKTYPVYSHPPAPVPVAPVGPVFAPVHVAHKAVSVVPAGLEVAVTPAPVVASPVPVSSAPFPVSVSPAVAYSAAPVVAVTPAPAVVAHSAGDVVAITPAPAVVAAAPAVVKAAPAPAPVVVSKAVVAAAPHPAPVAVVAAPAVPVVAGAVTTQHHAQDELGQYSYGYSNPLSAKEEVKTVDGITRGGYSYLDSHGAVQSVNYVSDHVNGFRVAATNLPVQPVHVSLPDSPDVASAKVKFFAEIAKAKEAVEAANQADALLAAHAHAHEHPVPYAHVQPVPHAHVHPVQHAHYIH